MKTKIMIGTLVLGSFTAVAQTNVAVTNTPDVGQAIGVLVHAVAPNVSMEQVASLVTALFVIARLLRKAIPDSAQTGALGTFLKHIALEINPQDNPTPSNVPVKTVELVGQATGETVKPQIVNPPITNK